MICSDIFPGKKYDSFIVYDSDTYEDRSFVKNKLIPELENRLGYRLCIIDRDFIVGQGTFPIFVDAVPYFCVLNTRFLFSSLVSQMPGWSVC